jgi:hypothetical protein
LVADASGIIATTCGGCVCDVSTSYAAEWLGKLAAARLALAIGVPLEKIRWSIADNITAPRDVVYTARRALT